MHERRCQSQGERKCPTQSKAAIAARRDLLIAGGVTFIALGGSAIGQPARPTESTPLYKVSVEQMIAGWKSKPQEVARTMLAKYGLPQEATPMRLIWHYTGPGFWPAE